MNMSIEDRFAKIVKEMDAELTKAQIEIAELKSKLRIANYPIEQATNCGMCGQYKHTPWRDDNFGYICATCLVEMKDAEIKTLKSMLPKPKDKTP